MSYPQLHKLLENNIVYKTQNYKLAKLNEEVYIKVRTGVQTCYVERKKVLEYKYTAWMSIAYTKTQIFWYSKSLQAKILQGIRKADKFVTHKNI